MSFQTFIATRIIQIVILAAFFLYDFLIDDSTTMNLILSLDFSNIVGMPLIIIVILWYVARIISTFLHEVGHWIFTFGTGKIEMKWANLFIPFLPGPAAQVSGPEIPLIEPLLLLAGIVTQAILAVLVFLFFNDYTFLNYLHIFIFLFGFVSLTGAVGNTYNAKEQNDLSKFSEKLNIHPIVRYIFAIIVCSFAIIFFKEYYVDNLIMLVRTIPSGNFFFAFNLPF
ncbi:hypothetical protein ACFLZX_00255 [Nanoarchaeota archaeon]